MNVRLDFRADHLLVVVDGAYDRTLAGEELRRILDTCDERAITRLLIDGRGVPGGVGIQERLEAAALLASRRPATIRVAILVAPENMFSKMIEASAVSRGAQVRTTDSLEEAVAYLGISIP
jgi:hypothetical protein